jgi:polar amino acid transport system substrate-binding protein
MLSKDKLRASVAAVVVGVCGLLALAAPSAQAQAIDQARTKGELTVGLLVDFPPYGILNAQNKPDGYDADVARLLAKSLNLKLQLVPVTGPNRIPFLLTNKVDLLIASLAVTPARAEQVQFSRPYSAAQIVLFGDKDAKISSAADLSGLRVGVARASTQDVAVTKIAPKDANIRRFDDDASAMQALLSGQVDAIGCSTTVAAVISRRAPNRYAPKFVLLQQEMAVAMRKGDEATLKAVNAFIDENIRNGELSRLYQKWLGTALPEMKAS